MTTQSSCRSPETDTPLRSLPPAGPSSRAVVPLPAAEFEEGQGVGNIDVNAVADQIQRQAEVRPTAWQEETATLTVAVDPIAEVFSDVPAPQPVVYAGLNLQTVLNWADNDNPSIRQARSIASKAQGTREQIGLCPNPEVGYMGQEMGDNGTSGMQGGFIMQTIVTGGKLGLNEEVAVQEVRAMMWQVEVQRWRVHNDVRRTFIAAYGAQERVRLAQELLQIAEDGVENARTLETAGLAAQPDVLQAEIQLQEIEVLRRNAEFELNAQWRQLASLAGRPDLPLQELDYDLEAQGPLRDYQLAEHQLLANSPQIQQAYAEVRRARARISREEVQPIPNVDLQFAAMHMNVSDDNGVSVMASIPLPVNNDNYGNINRAMAEYQRASFNVQRLELQLQSQLAAAFGDYQNAENQVRTYRDEIVPREASTLELIEANYPAVYDFLRLLTARRSYYDARLELLRSQVELHQAEVLLDGLLLTGGLNDLQDSMLDDGLRGSALMGR
ncbi:MAG: TolC family protein [Thermomicrobiales bacterium]